MGNPAGCGPLVRTNRLRTVAPGRVEVGVQQPARGALGAGEQVAVAVQVNATLAWPMNVLSALTLTPAAIM
jgi:hypothetical protein